jgi:ABC-2 type transport system permease protein
MRRTLTSFWSLIVASCKMYFRNKTAIFFTMVLPIAYIGVFGLLSQGGGSKLTLAVTNESKSELSRTVVSALKDIKAFEVTTSTRAQARDRLAAGRTDLQVIIPENLGALGPDGQPVPSQIETYYNQAKPQNGQTANLILGQVVSGLNARITNTPQIVNLKSAGIQTKNLGAIDFLLPGILAISIMQLGIFSVAFAFVSLKTTGALRRLQATPTHPLSFIAAQAVTRMIVGVLQVVILTGLGLWFFDFHLNGNPFAFLLVAMLGVILFLAFGFAVAGYAKDENSAAPIANLVTFPMLFLSGTFVPRDTFPDWLANITGYFPLTYLADALRQIANEGAHLSALSTDILGMLVWSIIMFLVAVRVFRWE